MLTFVLFQFGPAGHEISLPPHLFRSSSSSSSSSSPTSSFTLSSSSCTRTPSACAVAVPFLPRRSIRQANQG